MEIRNNFLEGDLPVGVDLSPSSLHLLRSDVKARLFPGLDLGMLLGAGFSRRSCGGE